LIGFDLDGVLIPDHSGEGTLEEYFEARVKIFKPLFDLRKLDNVCVVTGRPFSDYSETLKWFNKHIPGVKLFHSNPDIKKAKYYKEKVINENGIKIFFESDLEQVEHLRKNTDAEIIHWETFLLENIQKQINLLNSKEK
jgi:FMN phosphatase YigB (HAD superfamily)